MTQHTCNNNTEKLVNHDVNNTNDNKTTTTQKDHTQRQVLKQGNGINGKEIKRIGSHMTTTTTTQERREREKVKTHKPKKNKCQTTHTKPSRERERQKNQRNQNENQDPCICLKIGAASGSQTAFAPRNPLFEISLHARALVVGSSRAPPSA